MISRRFYLLAFGLLLSLTANAQRRHGVGLHYGGYDFYGPQTSHYGFSERYEYDYDPESRSYDSSTRDRLFWKPLVKFSYWWAVNKQIDLSLQLSLASLRYPTSRRDQAYIDDLHYNVAGTNVDKFLGELDFRFAYNILPKEDFILSPYVTAGVNGSYHDIFFGADIPLGAGLNINLSKADNLFLNLESVYKIAATSHDVSHLQHTAGFVYWFTPGYRKQASGAGSDAVDTFFTPPTTDVTTVGDDADNDGIIDSEDDCPSVAGLAKFNGCPDSDDDGVGDKEDECPFVAGKEVLKGCPDSDSDGISDKDDRCPYAAGTADRQGCPPGK